MSKFKNVTLASGVYHITPKGEAYPGLDLGRFVRDIMRQCGYDCTYCSETNCFTATAAISRISTSDGQTAINLVDDTADHIDFIVDGTTVMSLSGKNINLDPNDGEVVVNGATTGTLRVNSNNVNSNARIQFSFNNSTWWTIQDEFGTQTDDRLVLFSPNGGVYLPGDVVNPAWVSFSDESLKENISDIKVLDKVDDFRLRSYNWKENGEYDEGVIAQEINKIFPNIVSKAEEGKWGVAYSKIGMYAMQAVKELKAEVEALKSEIKLLKG